MYSCQKCGQTFWSHYYYLKHGWYIPLMVYLKRSGRYNIIPRWRRCKNMTRWDIVDREIMEGRYAAS